LGILSWINNASNKKLGKLFPTCGTTNNSLDSFSQINSRNNTKCGRLFTQLVGTTKTSLKAFSLMDQQTQAIKSIWKAFCQLAKQQKIPWTVSLRSTAETIQNAKNFLTTCGTTKNSLDSFSDQRQKQHKIWKAFSNLWNNKNFFRHFLLRSTAETIQNAEDFLTTCGTTKNSLDILSWINNASNKKFRKLFATCGTTKISLGIFSQINSRNNTKSGRLFATLWNKIFSRLLVSEQENTREMIWKTSCLLKSSKKFSTILTESTESKALFASPVSNSSRSV
jgi:hypothetical protein